jgi:membrane protein implicated in regulation of membrane protease activity
VTPSARALWWHYLLASLLTAHCGITSARNGALWYAAGLFGVSLLLLVALAREYVAADERRAAAVRAERAARLRAQAEQRDIRRTADSLGHSCCERWWTSCGFHHDSTCTSQRRTA